MKFDLWRYEGRVPAQKTVTSGFSEVTYPVPGALIFGCGLLFQSGGLWIGAHYSSACRRWCLNLLPCLTLWVALPGGQTP